MSKIVGYATGALLLVVLLALTVLPPILHAEDIWNVLWSSAGLQVWADASQGVIVWLGGIFRSLFPWPFVLLVLIVLFTSSKITPQIEALARSLQRLEILGTKVEFSRQSQPVVFGQLEKVNEFILLYRRQVRDTLQQHIASEEIYDLFRNDVERCFERLFGRAQPETVRATVHIEDFIFLNFLQQLFDYHPVGGGAGRAFSVRYGVIGKVWRSRKPYAAGRLLPGEMAERPAAEKREQISVDWAMTTREAQAAAEHPSYLCVPITHQHRLIGLVYADSLREDTFGPDPNPENIQQTFQTQFDESGFAMRLASFIDRYGQPGPRVELDLGKV